MRKPSDIARDLQRCQDAAGVRAIEAGYRTRFVRCDRCTLKPVDSLKGLTSVLHDVLYPRHRLRKRGRKQLGIVGGSSATRGTHTHAHVRHLVNCVFHNKEKCCCPRALPKDAQARQWACTFLRDVQKLGYEPVLAECPAWAIGHGLMTLVDVVVRAPAGHLACIELKTGYEGSTDKTCRADGVYLRAPFGRHQDDSHNTAFNRHAVQAVMSSYLFNNAYSRRVPDLLVEEAWVVYINRQKHERCHFQDKTEFSWLPAHNQAWAHTFFLDKLCDVLGAHRTAKPKEHKRAK